MADTVPHYRKIYEKMPASIEIPKELQGQRVEVLLAPLESAGSQFEELEADELGWTRRFIERTAGQWAGAAVVHESPGDYDVRKSLD